MDVCTCYVGREVIGWVKVGRVTAVVGWVVMLTCGAIGMAGSYSAITPIVGST